MHARFNAFTPKNAIFRQMNHPDRLREDNDALLPTPEISTCGRALLPAGTTNVDAVSSHTPLDYCGNVVLCKQNMLLRKMCCRIGNVSYAISSPEGALLSSDAPTLFKNELNGKKTRDVDRACACVLGGSGRERPRRCRT